MRFRPVVALVIFFFGSGASADYSTHPRAEMFIQNLVEKHDFAEDYVKNILRNAEKKQTILDAIARPAEKVKPWKEYRNIFLGEKRVVQGVEFWQKNLSALEKASEEFGVPANIIVAIIGVETRYGRHKGKYRVIDALATLGFDYEPRANFFIGELEQFFLLAREQKQDPLTLLGSYAGAMGYGQFIPSSYRNFAVDYDGDDFVDIWENPVDAIGSVANYFKKNGWQSDGLVLSRTRVSSAFDKEIVNESSRPSLTLKELREKGFIPVDKALPLDMKAVPLMYEGVYGREFWLGYKNFYAITRYNRSRRYAMAVWQLSRLISYEYETAGKS